MSEATETAAFLANSRVRLEILRELRSRGKLPEPTLRNDLDCSRPAVARNLDALEDRGWIRTSDGRYELTTAGAFVLEGFEQFLRTARAAERARPVLDHLRRADLDLDLAHLHDAAVVDGDRHDPLAMVNHHVSRIRGAECFRAVLPIVGLHAHETVNRRVLDGELTAELVVSTDVAETLRRDPDYAELTDDLLRTDRYDLLVTDEEIPFYLGVLNDVVQIGVDEAGDPRALVESDCEAVRTWAVDTIATYREAAEPIS